MEYESCLNPYLYVRGTRFLLSLEFFLVLKVVKKGEALKLWKGAVC